MKKILLLSALMISVCSANAQTYNYDVNGDGKSNVEDVTLLVNHILGKDKATSDHEYVDLGLSVKWATCNVGATNPEDYGLYFAWGETTGYTSDTSDGHAFDWASLKYCSGATYSGPFTKYVTSSTYGKVDNLITLDKEDDAAAVNWGGSWRMPTGGELADLMTQCTWTWTTEKGVNGYKVTSKKEGYTDKSIFLPASGTRYGTNLFNVGSYGYYWSSSLIESNPINAYNMYFNSSNVYESGYSRCGGRNVRPVFKAMNYDVNGDSKIDREDVTCLVNYILGKGETGDDHEYVDLGLSVKWATCNVGATTPEDYGLYFAWGETTGYTSDTSDGHSFDLASYKYCKGSETTMTKYCTSSSYGSVDSKTVLEASDDAAAVNWGGSWRMPTDAELTELRTSCTWTWTTTENGVNGYKVTSNKEGYTDKSIFLPAAGSRYGSSLGSAGSYGYYWSSSLYSRNNGYAQDLYFRSSGVFGYGGGRYGGLSVRPVCQ